MVDASAPRLHVGCPMWAHKPWRGRFLPVEAGSERQLAAYATWCNAVEGNITFYALPTAAVASSWAGQAPVGFEFTWKLPRTITHERRLRDCADQVTAFFDAVEMLQPCTGAVVAQLPASFGPSGVDSLGDFLEALPSGWRYAVEVRHPVFFDGSSEHRSLDAMLAGHGCERVILDSRTLYSTPPTSDAERMIWGQKPRLAVVPAPLTDRPIVRFIGRDDVEATAQGWAEWVDHAEAWLDEGRTPTVFVHTPDNVESLPLARRFHAEVGARVASLAPLLAPAGREPQPRPQAIQPSLF
jgi:uncharacterized protein YecE (DUF72 family)